MTKLEILNLMIWAYTEGALDMTAELCLKQDPKTAEEIYDKLTNKYNES